MAEINKEVLERLVSCKANTISASCDSSEFLIALAADLIDPTNKKFSVPNAAALPNLYGAPLGKGTMIYVESLGIHLIALGEQWCTLDGREYRNDGPSRTVWGWGWNDTGEVGDNTNVSRSSPVSVVGGFTDWCQVGIGKNISTGLKTNGTIWSWGRNNYGQLGDGTTTSRSSPVSVVGGFTDWCQVSAGSDHMLAVRTNGTAWAWGRNNYGQLGINVPTQRVSPVSVVGGFTDWCQVSAGGNHSIALRNNGTIWSWGSSNNGELGDNSTTAKSSPVSVVGGFTDWCQVSAGRTHNLAIRSNGTVWSWGININGRLGTGNTLPRSSPVSVVGGFTDWCQVSAGYSSSAAIRSTGSLWAWGTGGNGQLGDNSIVAKSSPVSVVGGFTDWCQVSAGGVHMMAVRTNGTLWAWGFNGQGRLGDNSVVNASSPVSVVGGFTDWKQSSAGYCGSLATRVT